MSDSNPTLHRSPFSAGDPFFTSQSSKSNNSTLDSLLKEAASSAQVYLYHDDEAPSPKFVESGRNSKPFIPHNLYQDSFSSELHTLPSHLRNIFEILQSKIGYQINYFSLESKAKSNEVQLMCKVCCKSLPIANVEEHTLQQEHLHNLAERRISNASGPVATGEGNCKKKTRKTLRNSKSCSAYPAVVQTNWNEKCRPTTNDEKSKKIVKDLTDKLKDSLNYLKPFEKKGSKPSFRCKMCGVSFFAKNARLHIYSNAHLRSLRKSLSVAELEASGARNKKIVEGLVDEFEHSLYFFQLVYDYESDELYFTCKVCAVVLIPEWLRSHIYSTEHWESVQENPVVLHYDYLNAYNKQIVRELTDAIQVCNIKDFAFVYVIGSEELRFYCKCCQFTLTPEEMIYHVETSKHVRAAKADANARRNFSEGNATNTALASSKTLYSDKQTTPSPSDTKCQHVMTAESDSSNRMRNSSQPYNSKNSFHRKSTNQIMIENMTSVSVSSGICSSTALSGLQGVTPSSNLKSVSSSDEGILKKYNNKNWKSDFDCIIESNNKTGFVCQDCGSVIRLKGTGNSTAHEELVKELFINCCGKSAERVLLRINSPPSSTTSNTSLLESKLEKSNDLCEEISKILINKVGLNVRDFDFIFSDLNKLRFKCKFCGVIMRAETVEEHVKHDSHVKYRQLSNVPSLGFESLNEIDKKCVRKLFNQIGNKINDYDAKISLGFVCKICGIYVKAKNVASHTESEGHLKYLSSLASHSQINSSAAPLDPPINNTSQYSVPMDSSCCNIL